MPKKVDLTGQRFNRLVVIHECGRKNGHVAWLCKCDCGNELVVSSANLRSWNTQSCGCLKPEKVDLTDQRFNRLVVIRECGRTKNGCVAWLCRCDCGNELVVSGSSLRNSHTQSCGCLFRERITTHDCTHEPWYPTYKAMMKRCGHWEGASERQLNNYRDKGIEVCHLWQKSPRAFGDWLMAHGWRKGLQIDRIDNNHGYSPENCRVVTPKENTNNRRNTTRLDDGTSLAMFCASIGIETCEGGGHTPKYGRILAMWKRAHKPHPELMQALKEDTDSQSRLLEITKLKVRRAELMIKGLKKLTTSKQILLDNPTP